MVYVRSIPNLALNSFMELESELSDFINFAIQDKLQIDISL